LKSFFEVGVGEAFLCSAKIGFDLQQHAVHLGQIVTRNSNQLRRTVLLQFGDAQMLTLDPEPLIAKVPLAYFDGFSGRSAGVGIHRKRFPIDWFARGGARRHRHEHRVMVELELPATDQYG
jgi:hypothetical protein